MTVIYSLYVDEGLIDELKRNIYTALKRLPIFRHFYTILQQKHSIADYLKQQKVKSSSRIPNSLVHLSRVLKEHDMHSFKGQSAMFLLQDLAPRYDDLVRSTHTNNTQLFFIQSRYIIESLSTIHVLMQEDEERNRVYHIHQSIKNFEAQASSRAFLNIEEDTYAENLANIDFIRSYYRNRFNVEMEENKITRLSGWALFLATIGNSEPLNSPDFVQLLGDAVLESKEEVRRLLVFYEESNAYTHITPYAFSPEKRVIHLSQIFHLVNQLLLHVLQEIFATFELSAKLSDNDKILFQRTLLESLIQYNTYSIIGN